MDGATRPYSSSQNLINNDVKHKFDTGLLIFSARLADAVKYSCTTLFLIAQAVFLSECGHVQTVRDSYRWLRYGHVWAVCKEYHSPQVMLVG